MRRSPPAGPTRTAVRSSKNSRTIAPNGAEATEFHISKPSGWPKGKYQVTLTMNGSTESKDFEVK